MELITDLLASKKPFKAEHYLGQKKKKQDISSLEKSSYRTNINIFLFIKQKGVLFFR